MSMTFFDNLKNKLYKDKNKKTNNSLGETEEGRPNKVIASAKGLFAKKPDQVDQAVEELDLTEEE